MSLPAIVHGSFTIQRRYRAPVARVFAAWSDIETKARWFSGPADEWTLVRRELDFRVGGTEILQGQFAGGRKKTLFVARYHVIVPGERLVYDYDMVIDDEPLSVSLATVEFSATPAGGTEMTFSEQAAFLDGKDGTKSREGGTAAHFDRLEPVLEDPHEIVSSRVFSSPRERVFRAFSDPAELAQWWGPKGFTNAFSEFEFRPGGAWRFAMRGPDGTEFQMVKNFVTVVAPERLALRNVDPAHGFDMTMVFTELGDETLLSWRMRFDSEQEAERVRAFVVVANEQNFDRLAAHLAKG